MTPVLVAAVKNTKNVAAHSHLYCLNINIYYITNKRGENVDRTAGLRAANC